MVQSLRNVTATPNIPVSSVTTTAPSTWQVTYSVACSQTWPSTCVQIKEASQFPAYPSAQVSLQMCRGKWCVLCHSQLIRQLMYSGAKTGNTPMTVGCSTLWSQPESTAPNGKKPTVDALVNSLLVSLQAFISGT